VLQSGVSRTSLSTSVGVTPRESVSAQNAYGTLDVHVHGLKVKMDLLLVSAGYC